MWAYLYGLFASFTFNNNLNTKDHLILLIFNIEFHWLYLKLAWKLLEKIIFREKIHLITEMLTNVY